jgi:hypothetical protein
MGSHGGQLALNYKVTLYGQTSKWMRDLLEGFSGLTNARGILGCRMLCTRVRGMSGAVGILASFLRAEVRPTFAALQRKMPRSLSFTTQNFIAGLLMAYSIPILY